MCLAVQSQHSLDLMQQWVEQTFSLVPNNGQERWVECKEDYNL
jgi:secreted Zn-dependent insulinase-like peptidase